MKKFLITIFIMTAVVTTQAQENGSNKIPFSPSIKTGNLLFISGQVGIEPKTAKLVDASFEAELRQVMENLKKQLDEHDLQFDDLVSTIIYLKDMDNYDMVNKIYGTYFKERYPSRTCIAVKDLPAKASVEISGIAEITR